MFSLCVLAFRGRSRAHLGVVSTDGFVLQYKQHLNARATRGNALVRAHRGHAVEAPGELYLACRYRCRLSASAELATREIQPSKMVENSHNNLTVASGETCFGVATRVGKTIARTYSVPLAAPSARLAPVPRGIVKLIEKFKI